jgi:hypothetical protein
VRLSSLRLNIESKRLSFRVYKQYFTNRSETGAKLHAIALSMSEVVQRLRSYMRGWKGYFQLAQTPKVWRRLDEWLRHRLRAIQLKQWKRGTTMYRELLKLGAAPSVARQVAANSRRWWRNSDRLLKTVMTIAYFDRLGVPRLT